MKAIKKKFNAMSIADLHHFITAMDTLLNNHSLSDEGAKLPLELFALAREALHSKPSKTPEECLIKHLLIAEMLGHEETDTCFGPAAFKEARHFIEAATQHPHGARI